MLIVNITANRPGRWSAGIRTSAWRRQLPESWADIPERLRARYYALVLADDTLGIRAVLRDLLRLPGWALLAMPATDAGAMLGALAWMKPVADCKMLPFPRFEHRGITYHFPKPKGSNVTCLEYPLADEYYMRFVGSGQGDAEALCLLVATLCREEDTDTAAATRRGDPRIPLNSRAEVEARAKRLTDLPAYLQFATLLYFAGLKEYIYRTYKDWIFDDEDIEEDETQDDEPDDDDYEEQEADTEPERKPVDGPDFGWWGIFQDVAEAGLFGNLDTVYHTSLHNVAMWLVRQRMRADAQRQQLNYIRNNNDR